MVMAAGSIAELIVMPSFNFLWLPADPMFMYIYSA